MSVNNWRWFRSIKGTVGIVQLDTPDGFEYRITPVDGFLEKMDVQQIIAWGTQFPKAAGDVLFGEKNGA